MSYDSFTCPVCNGAKQTMAFVCGRPEVSGLRALTCQTCKGVGSIPEWEMRAYNEQAAKKKQRRAVREALDLSMMEMAKRMGMSRQDYNDYEHGRRD